MNRKELSELKSQYQLTDCSISRISGCYVDGDKQKVSTYSNLFLNLPEEDLHKYFEIFKKVVSGGINKNILNMKFIEGSSSPDIFHKIRKSELKNEDILNEFYDNVIENYDYTGNYLILLIHQTYDVPAKATDGADLDESEEIYDYIMCCICPVKLSKPGLGYIQDENSFHNQKQNHIVDMPEVGFIFPAFNERTSDDTSLWLYSKSKKEFPETLINNVLQCSSEIPAEQQKAIFKAIIEDTMENCDVSSFNCISNKINELVEADKENGTVSVLNKDSIRKIFEESDIPKDKLERLDSVYEEYEEVDGKLFVSNLIDNNIKIESDKTTINVKTKNSDIVGFKEINGKKYITIEVNESEVTMNGINVKL